MTWAKKILDIKARTETLEKQDAEIRASIKPIEDKIKDLQESAEPFYKKLAPINDELGKLKWKLEVAEAWAYIENLQVGNTIWILARSFGELGIYDVMDEDQLRRWRESIKQQKVKEKYRFKPHILTVRKVEPNHVFYGTDENEKEYRGDVEIMHWVQEGKPRLIWRRIKGK